MWGNLVNAGCRRFWLGGVATALLLGSCLLAVPTVAAADPFFPRPAAAVITFAPQGTPRYTDPYPTPSELWEVSAQSDVDNCSTDCWANANGTGNEDRDGWVYLTVTRGTTTIATSSANNGGASVAVRGLQVGDAVTVYAKRAVFEHSGGPCLDCGPGSGSEGFVPSPDPYHVAATATFQPGPVISHADCGEKHPHTEVSGSPGVGATNVALAWEGRPGTNAGSHAAAGSVSGDSFTATDPHVANDFTLGGPQCTSTGPVAGIRYEPEPDGVVQVSQYALPYSIYETGFLAMGRGASFFIAPFIAPRHRTSVHFSGSHLAMGLAAFCAPAQMSTCRVSITARLRSARPTVIGRGAVSVGWFGRPKLTFINAGVREVRARLRSTPRGFSLPLTFRLTGTGRTPVVLHITVRALR